MAEQDSRDTGGAAGVPPLPTLEEMQHWTWVMGRAQQMMLEHVAKAAGEAAPPQPEALARQLPWLGMFPDPAKLAEQQVALWTEGMGIWQRALGIEAPRTAIEE